MGLREKKSILKMAMEYFGDHDKIRH